MCPSVASLLPRGRSAETTAEKQYFGYKSVGHGPLRDFYGCLSTSIMAALSRVVYPGASTTPVAQSCVPKVTFHESELSARHRSLWRAVGHYRCGLSVLMAVPVSPWRKPRRQLPRRTTHDRFEPFRGRRKRRAVANLRR